MPEPPETAGAAGEEEAEGKKRIPDGIAPIFFSGASQQIYECVADSDVTSENPHKLVPKAKIEEDFRNRAAICDFQPVKQKILNYPGDEILLVYDYGFMYGENYYVCLTEEAKELVLNPPEEEGEGKEGGGELEEEENEVPKTPEPKEWDCLGSDVEIQESIIQLSRPRLEFTVSRKRKFFGSACSFSDRSPATHADAYLEVKSEEGSNFDLKKTEMEVAVQAVPEKSDSSCQTKWGHPCNAAIQYCPRSVSEEEARAALEDKGLAEFLTRVCPRLELTLQQNEIMDMFVDDYRLLSDTDFITGSKYDSNLKEYQSFMDLKFSKDKSVTHIEWHPTIKGIIAVSCADNYSFDERIELSTRLLLSPSLVILWSFTDPIHPQLFLQAPDDVLCFQFNPNNPSVVVGGCSSGQLVLWDLEPYQDRLQVNKTSDSVQSFGNAANLAVFDTDLKLDHAPIVQHCASSAIEHSHTMPVTDLRWLPDHIEVCQKTFQVLENTSRVTNQIISCSVDGSVMFWDVRPPITKRPVNNQSSSKLVEDQPFSYLDLIWKPLLKIPLPRTDYPGNFSTTRVSIKERQKEATKGTDGEGVCGVGVAAPGSEEDRLPLEGASTSFYAGTEDGEVLCCDWVPTRDSESGKTIAQRPHFHLSEHCGAVCCARRSPFYRDTILTVGGWTFAIWKEGVNSDALLKSCSSSVPLTGGAWSPTRPGIFFITKLNGDVDVWDLMDRSHEPALVQNVSSLSITAVQPWSLSCKQQMLAVGDSAGTLHILELPWSLSQPSRKEVSIMEGFFEREVRRVEFAASRAVVRAQEKRVHDTLDQVQEDSEANQKADGEWEERARKDYEQYLAMEKALLIQLGLVEAPGES